ncbi:MAG: hypothetical protein ACYCY3_05920 [Halothiobacillus sp.]
MISTPQALIQAFVNGVNTGDTETLIGLYHEKAVLIPTFSNRMRKSPDRIRDYFETLGKHKDMSLGLHDNTVTIIPITGNSFAISGLYCWRFSVDDEMLNFEARFSYVVNLDLPRPILQHHSSQIPRTL